MRLLDVGRYLGVPRKRPRPCFQHLELHVTHVCNLTCESCSHYSNQGHHGHLTLADADKWLGLWSHRVDVDQFHLLGGEPTTHPELARFVPLVRRHWPKTQIQIRTNGFFLNRHPDLPRELAAAGRAIVVISVHHDSAEYRQRLFPTFDLVEGWRRDYGIEVTVAPSFANWTRRYHGFGDAMEPFEDGAPRASWEICPARECKQLFEGQIWKCAPLAYLKVQKAKYRLSSKWDFYASYKPLAPACSDRELDRFIAREEETFCGMCPARPQPFAIPIPIPGRAVTPVRA